MEDGSGGKVFGMQAWGLQFDPQKPGKEKVRHDSICCGEVEEVERGRSLGLSNQTAYPTQ